MNLVTLRERRFGQRAVWDAVNRLWGMRLEIMLDGCLTRTDMRVEYAKRSFYQKRVPESCAKLDLILR